MSDEPAGAGAGGVKPASVQLVSQTGAIVELVKAGLGIAVLARWAIDPFVRASTRRCR
jgi:DNA-binding transcriptional LysR family regulator